MKIHLVCFERTAAPLSRDDDDDDDDDDGLRCCNKLFIQIYLIFTTIYKVSIVILTLKLRRLNLRGYNLALSCSWNCDLNQV